MFLSCCNRIRIQPAIALFCRKINKKRTAMNWCVLRSKLRLFHILGGQMSIKFPFGAGACPSTALHTKPKLATSQYLFVWLILHGFCGWFRTYLILQTKKYLQYSRFRFSSAGMTQIRLIAVTWKPCFWGSSQNRLNQKSSRATVTTSWVSISAKTSGFHVYTFCKKSSFSVAIPWRWGPGCDFVHHSKRIR